LVGLPAAGWAVGRYVSAQIDAAHETDRRVNYLNELIQGIRVIKYYAWERPFADVVDQTREAELKHLARYLMSRVC
jgi:ATP-binding cassette subfamily C (CFTR/MRP) protein 4